MAGLTEGTVTNHQQLVFSPESRVALQNDLSYLQMLLQQLGGVHGGILDWLSGKNPLYSSILAQPTTDAADVARTAVGNAGEQRGMSPRSLASTDAMLGAETPTLLSPVGQLARQYTGGINSLIDPRFAEFMKPMQINSTSSQPSALDTATTILKAAGGVASAFA